MAHIQGVHGMLDIGVTLSDTLFGHNR